MLFTIGKGVSSMRHYSISDWSDESNPRQRAMGKAALLLSLASAALGLWYWFT